MFPKNSGAGMISFDDILRLLRREHLIPSECERVLPSSNCNLVSLSDTSNRTLGEFQQFYDLHDFRAQLNVGDLKPNASYMFFDYSWSYLTSPEQKLFMKVAIPSAIVIATPECVGTLSTGILKIESLQAILSIARHQLGDRLYIRYTRYSYPDLVGNEEWCRSIDLNDIYGYEFFSTLGFKHNFTKLTTALGTVNCYVYQAGGL